MLETKPCQICGDVYTGDKRSLICKKEKCRKARGAQQARKYAQQKKGMQAETVVQAETVPMRPLPLRPLPWAEDALCRAVQTALGTRGVWKLGAFYILDYGSQGGYQAYVPTAENRYDTPLSRQSFQDKIVLTARLNERKRWELRATTGAG